MLAEAELARDDGERGELRALREENAALRARLAEHERQRTRLVQQQAVLRSVIASIPYFVFWKDRESRYLGCNDRLAEIAGLPSADAVVGKTDYDLPWTREQSDLYRSVDRRVMKSNEPVLDFEETIDDQQKRRSTVLTSKVPLRDEQGNVIGMLGIFTDITARKQLELDLAAARDTAEEANRAKTDFIAAVSHELRTPLSLVLGPLDSLRKAGNLPPDAQRELERVHRNARRLKVLLDDILDFAKADADKMVVGAELVDVTELTEAIVDEVRSAATTKGIELSARIEPTGLMLVDRHMYEKILLNLLGNALKFTDGGGKVDVVLSVRGEEVELAVTDTGIGIDPTNHHRLFQRFQQIDTSSTRRYEGTGLGLALVKQFIDLMGGRIGVESALGEGSRFAVVLPRTAPEIADMRPAAPKSVGHIAAAAARIGEVNEAGPAPSLVPFGRGGAPLVLVVEDNPELCTYVVELLSPTYAVLACPNGVAALELLERHVPDVIVSDVMMPEMDGHELVSHLKGHEVLRHVPVILLTAQAGADEAATSLSGGADDFLGKPFNPGELCARVAVAVRLRAAYKALAEKNRELVETRDMLVEVEKLSALGRLLTQLSHEINNPMTAIVSCLGPLDEYLDAIYRLLDAYEAAIAGTAKEPELDGLREELDVDFIREDFPIALSNMREAADRVCGIQRDLRSFLRGDGLPLATVDVNEGLKATVDMIRRGLTPTIAFVTSYGAVPAVRFNAGQLKQVFLNLIQNAVDALGRGGQIEVTSRLEGTTVQVVVADDGPGIPPAIRSKIFEPFFTTKDVGKGSGLGLAVCRQIVERHGGLLRLEETPSGARFVVEIPCALGGG